MADIAIEAEGLSKCYVIPVKESQGRYRTLRDTLSQGVTDLSARLGRADAPAKDREFWALKDVSFRVARGERVGIIGANGAGKSTLLKILSRIVAPTSGRAMVKGRLSALLEVGTGFHPELTGAENIRLNAALLGMSRAELARVFEEIVEFSGIAEHLDVPVKRYSSGMYTRLAFAVAAHLEPDILVVDEVLAVGDAAFQKKCIDRMQAMRSEARTIVFVSHNMALVNSLCTRAMVLHRGAVHTPLLPVNDAIARYNALTRAHMENDLSRRQDRQGKGDARFVDIAVGATAESADSTIFSGQPLIIRFELAGRPGVEVAIAVAVTNEWAHTVAYCGSENAACRVKIRDDGTARAQLTLPQFRFAPGSYAVNIAAHGPSGEMQDWLQSAAWFRCELGDLFGNGTLTPPGHHCVLPEQIWTQL